MYVSHTSSLYILTHDGGGETIQWTRSGDQGQKWHQAKIDLDLVAPTKVRLNLNIKLIIKKGKNYVIFLQNLFRYYPFNNAIIYI